MTPEVKENLKIIREKQKVVYENLLSILECCNKIDHDGETMYISSIGKQTTRMREYLETAMFNLNQAEKSL